MSRPEFLHTSGNLLVDRRYDYVGYMIETGELKSAIDLLLQTQDLAPHWPVIPYQLGCLYNTLNQHEQALHHFKTALTLDPHDYQGASMQIARTQNFYTADNSLPPAFVKTLFDQYAERFDAHLLQKLDYRVPLIISDMMTRHQPDFNAARLLDLGCGTGLAAEFFAPQTPIMIGVDLSPGMLAQAAEKNIYHALVEQDLLCFLSNSCPPESLFDLVLAADVLTYFGDLDHIFAQLFNYLTPNGIFAFSVQDIGKNSSKAPDFMLEESNRFTHKADYIYRMIKRHGYNIVACESHTIRRDRNEEVPGLVYICRRLQNTPLINEEVALLNVSPDRRTTWD